MDNQINESTDEKSFDLMADYSLTNQSIDNNVEVIAMNDNSFTHNNKQLLEISISQQNLLINQIESKSELLVSQKNKLINQMYVLKDYIQEVKNKESELLEVATLINSSDFQSNTDQYLIELSDKYNEVLQKFESLDLQNNQLEEKQIEVRLHFYLL